MQRKCVRFLGASVVTITALLLSTGCTAEGSAQDVLDFYAARHETATRIAPERGLADLLPNQHFAIDGAAPAPLSSGVVIGTILNVEPGRGYVVEGDDAPTGQEVEFANPNALWRTISVELEVERQFDTSLGIVDQVRFGLPIDGATDYEAMRQGLISMGRVVVVLDPPGAFSYDPSLYRVHWDGVFLAPVSDDGTFVFSALGDEARHFQGGLDTIAELSAAHEARRPVVESARDGHGRRNRP